MAFGFTVTAITGNEVKITWSAAAGNVKLWRSDTAISNPPTGLTDEMIIASDLTGATGTFNDYEVEPSSSYYYIGYDGTSYYKAASAVTTPSKGEFEGDYVPSNLNKINENQLYVSSQNANGSVAIAPIPLNTGTTLTIVAFESNATLTDADINSLISGSAKILNAQLFAYMNTVKQVSGYNPTLNGTLQVKYIVAQNG